MSNWRDIARPIIAEVIQQNKGKSIAELRRLIRKKYPFGEIALHPYKIWRSEVRKQLEEVELKGRETEGLPLFRKGKEQ